MGVSSIAVRYFRHKQHNVQDLICPLRKVTEEDEIHFVLCCEAYLHLRVRYLHIRFYTLPNLSKLSVLLAPTDQSTIKNLVLFFFLMHSKLETILQ